MGPRILQLISERESTRQRAHFGILVAAANTPNKGTLIHVVGAPMMGYMLQFRRNFDPTDDNNRKTCTAFPLCHVDETHVVDSHRRGRDAGL